MRGTLTSRTVLALATLMLVGACNTPYEPSAPDPVVSTGEQAPKPKPQIDKGITP